METIRDYLLKIKSLAESGATEGERLAAQGKLAALLSKRGLTLDDLTAEKARRVGFVCPKRARYHQRLIVQIIARFAGRNVSMKWGPAKRGDLGVPDGKIREYLVCLVTLTPTQESDISAAINHYGRDLHEQMNAFYSAYIQKNDLGIEPEEGGGKAIDPKELARLLRMMGAIDENPLRKQLENTPPAT